MKPLVVIGLDGATEAVLRLADARLPNIAALRREGCFCLLRSTVPPVTAAAWASMFTGWNPGRHGMYDFRRLAIERYTRLWGAGHSAAFTNALEFVTSRQWAGAAFWDLLGDGRRVGVLSVPMTFPPWRVNGDMIAGFPLPDYDRNHSHPPELGAGLPPLLDAPHRLKRLNDAELASRCLRMIERQGRVVLEWVAEGSYDVVVAVFQSTDFAQHRLWKYLEAHGDPRREALLELYRAVDRLVGEVRGRVGPEGTVAVVSDHGFGPHPTTFVHTDVALAEKGLLTRRDGGSSMRVGSAAQLLRHAPKLRRALRLTIDRLPRRMNEWMAGEYSGANQIDWEHTRAYRVPLYAPAEGVVVNVKGRQSQGIVEPGSEYEQVRDEIIAALLDLADPSTGLRPVRWARRREELYRGEYVEEAPDVVALFEPTFKGSWGLRELFEPVPASLLENYSGVHAMEGIFAAAGPGVVQGVDLGTREIVDVAPTLLALVGVPAPEGIDGLVMAQALRTAAPVGASSPHVRGEATAETPLSAQEHMTMEQSLRALGYLG